jgi:hypothetical protein
MPKGKGWCAAELVELWRRNTRRAGAAQRQRPARGC